MSGILAEQIQGRRVVVVIVAVPEREAISGIRVGCIGDCRVGRGVRWSDVGVGVVVRWLDIDLRRSTGDNGLCRMHIMRDFRDNWLRV